MMFMLFLATIVGAAAAVVVTAGYLAMGRKKLRSFVRNLVEQAAAQQVDRTRKAAREFGDAIDELHGRLQATIEEGQVTDQALRTERMKAVSAARTIKARGEASGGGDVAVDGAQGVPAELQEIIDHPFVKGFCENRGIDPEKVLAGDKEQIERVRSVLGIRAPASHNNGSGGDEGGGFKQAEETTDGGWWV